MDIQQNVSLAQFTTFEIGGPAKFFVEVRNPEDLKEAYEFGKENDLSVFILGGGSNLLFPDNGWDGLVIKISFLDLVLPTNELIIGQKYIVEVGAGVPMKLLAGKITALGLSGLEWAGGLPGSVGGAVRGNAGAFRFETKDVVKSVEALVDGERKTLTKEECEFSYRTSIFKTKLRTTVIIKINLELPAGDALTAQKQFDDYLKHRDESQPPYPSVGCVFKNYYFNNVSDLAPDLQKVVPENYIGYKKLPAAWILEQAGLKGAKVGGAEISTLHGNFIINKNGASAMDVLQLIVLIKRTVKEKFGIELEEEVQIVS